MFLGLGNFWHKVGNHYINFSLFLNFSLTHTHKTTCKCSLDFVSSIIYFLPEHSSQTGSDHNMLNKYICSRTMVWVQTCHQVTHINRSVLQSPHNTLLFTCSLASSWDHIGASRDHSKWFTWTVSFLFASFWKHNVHLEFENKLMRPCAKVDTGSPSLLSSYASN